MKDNDRQLIEVCNVETERIVEEEEKIRVVPINVTFSTFRYRSLFSYKFLPLLFLILLILPLAMMLILFFLFIFGIKKLGRIRRRIIKNYHTSRW